MLYVYDTSMILRGLVIMSIFWIVAILIAIVIGYVLYKRYVPIKGVPCVEFNKENNRGKITLDIRDYQEVAKDEITDAIVIPVPYLRRYYTEIPSGSIYVVASTHLEKNLAIRFLKNKGFNVIGYTLTECKCKNKISRFA